jgi:DNA-binding HxlR family transcriptional regulator
METGDPVRADERRGSFRRLAAIDRRHHLTTQLRELEQDGLVSRTVFAEKPLRVEYGLTDAAYGLLPAFKEILSWSRLYGDARLVASHQA